MTATTHVTLARPPEDPEELWHVVNALWGVALPNIRVCDHHVSPFAAFSDAYFAHDPNWALWYGSRGTGKSYMLALLALTKAALLDVDVVLLGGSMAQSINVREHVDRLLRAPNAPRYALAKPPTATEIKFAHQNWIRPIPASQTTVRGPHPAMTLLDEIDEMEYDIYTAAQGQAMKQRSAAGVEVPEMTVASSTWQNPEACVVTGTPIHTARGVIAVEEVVAGDEVMTRRGFRVVSASMNMGFQETVTVRFASGGELTCTPWHPVWTDSHGWCRADSLPLGAVACRLLPLTQSAGEFSGLAFAIPDGDVSVDAVGTGFGVGAAYDSGAGIVFGGGDGFEVGGVDAGFLAAKMVDDHAVADRSVETFPHVAVGEPRAFGSGGGTGVLQSVAGVVDLPRPHDTVVGVEVDGFAFVGDEVVAVHTGMVRATWDLTVDDQHEYVAAGVLTHNTFTKVYREAQSKAMPVHSWCYLEVLKTEANPHGWMDPAFIERKRRSVPAEMFRVEYELGEPSGMALAFDMASLEQAFSNDIVPVKQLERGEDTEFIYEEPDRAGVYAAGADWAKEKDYTVIVVVRVDCDPWRTAYVRRFNRRPWPYMIAEFERVVKDYQAVSAHDATGLGNVVHDLVDERTAKVVMVGKDRTKLLTDYITAVEQGRYALARPGPLYTAHRSVTVDEVFGSSTWKSHLADEVAACAIAHRAAVTQAPAVAAEGVQRGKGGVKWIEDLDGTGSAQANSIVTLQEVGVVTVIEEVSDVGVFWLE